MRKARTLDDIYNNFEGNRPLSENEYDFFINIYDKKLKRFIGSVKRNKNKQNIFFIAGQRGNGKSTILNNLKHENREFAESYEIRHIQAMEVFKYDDIDIVDILLGVGFNLIDNNDLDPEKKEKLEKIFRELLQKVEDVHHGELKITEDNSTNGSSETQAKASLASKVGFFSYFSSDVSLSSTYKADENIRKEAKRIYKFKNKDLLEMINLLIKQYQVLKNSPKEILLILDGLEKLNNIDDVFTKDIDLLRDLECFKIITMPVYLKGIVDIYNVKAIDFTMEIDKNGEIKDIELLKDVITSRIENLELITNEAIDLAIKMSGGNLRQLLEIIQKASTEALDVFESEIIDTDEVESAIELLQGDLDYKIQVYASFLQRIKETHIITKDDKSDLIDTLHSGLVFAYLNGKAYYDINPIIEHNLKRL
ncbi:MAG: P-loop NTPase fold protein [Bacteroidota bacterium]|nr:P-loop NTPase fold protein [Bacteroidota bacterium]